MNKKILFIFSLGFFVSAEASQIRRAVGSTTRGRGALGTMRHADFPTTISEDFQSIWKKFAASAKATLGLSLKEKGKK